MASKNGFPPIIGTYNGINYYIQDGKQRQRKAGGGFTTESIKNNPNMQGVRDANTEWALCSKFNRAFKEALFPFFNELNDGTLHQRLMKLFMKIRTFDEAPEGQRTVGNGLCTEHGKKMLQDFKFTQGNEARTVLGPVVDLNAKTGGLKAIAFGPNRIRFPKGNSHFSLDYGVLEYDLDGNSFRFLQNENPIMFAKEEETRTLVLEVPEKPKEGGILFGFLKLQFYQISSGKFYKSHAKNGVGIGVV